jgi:DnaJ-domain-containing protein 1
MKWFSAILLLATSSTVALELSSIPELSGMPQSSTRAIVGLAVASDGTSLKEWKSHNLDLTAVVDRSGSMADGKLDAVKKALNFVIGQLGEHDRLSLVMYDHHVETKMPPLNMDEHGKKRAIELTKSIFHRGGTDLCEGVLRGAEIMTSLEPDSSRGTRVPALLLMTDGLANQGVTDTDAILETLRIARKKTGATYPIHAFGFGHDHDGVLLQALSESTSGMYYWMDSNEQIAPTFADVLGGLVTTEALELTLNVKAEEGVKVSWWNSATDDPTIKQEPSFASEHETDSKNSGGQGLSLSLGDLQSGESRHRLLQLSLPSMRHDDGNDEIPPGGYDVKVATVTLEYINVTTAERQQLVHDVWVKRVPTDRLRDVVSEPSVAAQKHRIIAAEALQHSSKAHTAKDARAVLSAAIQKLKRGRSPGPVTKALLKDLEEARVKSTDARQFEKYGRQFSSARSSSHSMERQAAFEGLASEGELMMELDVDREGVMEAASVLGVAATAGAAEIKAAYRKLSHKYHPDKFKGAEGGSTAFARVKQAYDTFFEPAVYSTVGREAMRMNLHDSGD